MAVKVLSKCVCPSHTKMLPASNHPCLPGGIEALGSRIFPTCRQLRHHSTNCLLLPPRPLRPPALGHKYPALIQRGTCKVTVHCCWEDFLPIGKLQLPTQHRNLLRDGPVAVYPNQSPSFCFPQHGGLNSCNPRLLTCSACISLCRR